VTQKKTISLSRTAGLAWRYALISFVTHFIFISLSLIPGWRAESLVVGDSNTYLIPAQNLLQHGVFSRESTPPYLWEPYRTPGYPMLIAISIGLFGNAQWVLYFAAVTGGLAGWAAVRLTEAWKGKRMAQHVAGLIVALLPNSLGLSAMLLTDAVFGHLVLIWGYLLYSGLRNSSLVNLMGSTGLLWILQAIKPTFNIAALLILGIGMLFIPNKRMWTFLVLLVILSLPLPSYYANRNLHDHGVFTPSMLGVETVREYLQSRYSAEVTGKDFADLTAQVRAENRAAAEKLQTPISFCGRLYLVKQAEVDQFIRQHPWTALRLMGTEMVRQFAAPQEFVFQVFFGGLPAWARGFGSILTLLLWAGTLFGAWHLGRSGDWRPGLMVFGILMFFLLTGSVSHRVGARLRFPADMMAVPLAAIGLAEYVFKSKHTP